ncbi:MFS transporter [Sphingomonas sp. LB-2]|uniref:MFS transporter n=1 Tax=Sphingomonas caeni TaxID=2984949 RepID=UPI002230DC3E|nr:MFS transporter [Sphingomonas caeni]MCW3847008.1 MFS transporter [Sphingomonas caeni]
MEPVTKPRGAIAGLSLAMLMASLATSSANAALPALAQAFAASFQAVQWIILAYLLAVTSAIVVAGQLGDRIGRRRLLLAGIAIFTTASLLCGLAPALPLLVAARGVQGLGAAIMMALAIGLVGEVVAKARMGRAMGLLGTMSAIGTTLGPSLSGVLIPLAGWQAIFLINVPLGALVLMLVGRHVLADGGTGLSGPRIDHAGIALLLAALAAYALAMTIGHGRFGLASAALLLGAFGAGGAFLLVEARSASPLIRLSLFRDPALRTGLATNALVSTVLMATLVVGPFYLSGALGLDAAIVGMVLSAGPLVAALAGVPAGRFVDRFGAGRMSLAGLAAMTAAALALSLIPAGAGIAGYVLPIGVMTCGYAMFQAANTTAIMADAPPAQRGLVSGMLNLSRNLGLLTGASAMGAVFAFGVAGDIATAPPEAIAAGMRTTFAVATALLALALGMAARRGVPPAISPASA